MKTAVFVALSFAIGCSVPPTTTEAARRHEPAITDKARSDEPGEDVVLQLVRDAETTLMGPDGSTLAVGLRCGLAPWPSVRPWFAVRYLLAAHRGDVLKRVAEEAPTGEGRIWAAYGLVATRLFDEQDLWDVVQDSGPIWTCDRCITQLDTPTEAFEQLQ